MQGPSVDEEESDLDPPPLMEFISLTPFESMHDRWRENKFTVVDVDGKDDSPNNRDEPNLDTLILADDVDNVLSLRTRDGNINALNSERRCAARIVVVVAVMLLAHRICPVILFCC
mmetsp:Transcript_21266/g.29821  ORF Transcript_21266/g.29821 Transcript_21266/m.29821 type:complete len:116 (+) Transcript_21266:2084-2431(+)